MISIFFHLLILGYLTSNFEGYMAEMPLTALSLWLFGSVLLLYKIFPEYVDDVRENHRFPSFMDVQSKVQLIIVFWISALHCFCAPALKLFPELHKKLPETLPMVFSLVLYVLFFKLANANLFRLFKPILNSRQTMQDFFRARMTIPILFFPPMLFWIFFEDLFALNPEFADIQEIQTYLVAPVFFVALYLLAPRLFNWAWKAVPIKDEDLKKQIIEVSDKAQTPISGVKVWDTFNEPIPNAAVAGLSRKFRFIYITEYLLEIFNVDQVKGVLAHELGHLRLGHVWTYMIFSMDLIFLALGIKLLLYFDYYWVIVNAGVWYEAFEIFGFLFFFAVTFTYLARKSEKQADRFASVIVGKDTFNSSLTTLEEYISPPPSRIPRWMLTHPEIQDRIESVKNWQGDMPDLIKAARRTRLALILVGVILMAFSLPALNKVWTIVRASKTGQAGNLSKASALLISLPVRLNGHPLVSRQIGKLAMLSGHWDVAVLAAAKAEWNLEINIFKSLEVLHHPVTPEVALYLKLMKLLL